jgi:hypothetical protein
LLLQFICFQLVHHVLGSGEGALAGLEKVQMSYPYGVPFHKYQDVIRSKTFKSVYEWVMNTDTYYIIAGLFYQNVLY